MFRRRFLHTRRNLNFGMRTLHWHNRPSDDSLAAQEVIKPGAIKSRVIFDFKKSHLKTGGLSKFRWVPQHKFVVGNAVAAE